MDAPERIWAFNSKQTGYRFYANGPQPEFDNVEFHRADLCADPALLAEAVEVLRFYADKTAWSEPPVETVESILGTAYRNKASEIRRDRGARARAFIAKLENRHDDN